MPKKHSKPVASQPWAGSQSAFLQCLSQLNEDTFCQILLPKLIKHGSAGNLAATCSQLRKLCHNSIKKLNITPMLSTNTPSVIEEWTQHLQEHFPHCSTVQVSVQDKESYQAAQYVLPALARLPELQSLEVAVKGPPLFEMLPMAMLLLSLRTQLTSVRSLTLGLSQSWVGAGLAFAELARMTQLTNLAITSTAKAGSPCNKVDLLKISSLFNLRDLKVDLVSTDEAEHPVCFQLASQMSALTALHLKVRTTDGFSNIRNCADLQRLVLPDVWGVALEFSAADWGVIGQLTRLTQLVLWPVTPATDWGACRSALQQLTALRDLSADAWAPEVLPALQGLSCLTSLAGGWLPSDGVPAGVACGQVKMLESSFGHIPWMAFPNLLHFSLFQSITSSTLAGLSRHCRLMRTILSVYIPQGVLKAPCTLNPDEPVAERVAAVRSLSHLHHLTSLDFVATEDSEVMAVSEVAAALAVQQLARMRLVVGKRSEVSSIGLLGLAKVSGIALHVWLLKPTLMCILDVAQVFVAALGGLKDLRLVVAKAEQQTVLKQACEHVESCGLPLPAKYSISIL